MKRPTISYAITVYNEDKQLEELLMFIIKNKQYDDEIVVVTDEGHTTQAVYDVLNRRKGFVSVFSHSLNGNFANHKNFLNSVCRGEYIFNIDADEMPPLFIIENLHNILKDNPTCDLFWVPRINIVDGITSEYIERWHWTISKMDSIVNEKVIDIDSAEYKLLKKLDYIIEETVYETTMMKIKYYVPINCYPDWQGRIYKNLTQIFWINRVHEHLKGFIEYAFLPQEEGYSLTHKKTIDKQIEQNNLYDIL